jgi:hypothetical protein
LNGRTRRGSLSALRIAAPSAAPWKWRVRIGEGESDLPLSREK